MSNEKIKLAYLVSRYPAISHTFILREILHLKSKNFDIVTASINAPDRGAADLTAEEKSEAAQTFYVKPGGARAAARAHFSTALRRPLRYFAGLFYAFRLAGADLKKLSAFFFYFVEAVMIGEWMRGEDRTHLHVHFATPASTVALIVKRIYGVNFSMTVHGPDEFYNVKEYLLAEKIGAADFVCCIGAFARSQLMSVSAPNLWDKFEITPLGVDPEKFAPIEFRPRPETFEIICVGRLVPVKGQLVLLKAFEKLIGRGHNARLRFVGDGPDRTNLENFVRASRLESKVIFEGAVNQDRIRELYAQADLFALASFAEGIPVVLMEAMAQEIACVTTCITGIPELIRHNTDGVLVAASDESELAAALENLMNSPDLRRRLARAGRLRVIEKFHLERNTNRLAEVFVKRLNQADSEFTAQADTLPIDLRAFQTAV